MKKDYITYWNEKGEYGKTRISRMLNRKRLRAQRKSKRFTCSYCNKTFDNPVPYVADPYHLEINGVTYMQRMCDECYYNASMDI